MSLPLLTPRLVVSALGEEDLRELLELYLSNPRYLDLTEGSGGEIGGYDLARLERDAAVAGMTPGREMAVARLRTSGELVGVADWIDQNPSDGTPWLGLIMIHAEHQRRGLATELFEALCGHFRGKGWELVREGVIEENREGMELARALGFVPAGRTTMRLAVGERAIVVLERRL